MIRVEPGDQLVADGEVVSSRGLTIDESLLTGEADGIRKRPRRPDALGLLLPSRARAPTRSTPSARTPTPSEIAGEAKEFRHPPSPLQDEVNQVLWATTIILVPLAIAMLVGLHASAASSSPRPPRQATAGLITLIPEGLVLLMSVTLAVAARRLAAMDTLVQQMSATEALAAVDTICVDKTGHADRRQRSS